MNERSLLQRLQVDISAHARKCRMEREKLYPTLGGLAPADREKAQQRIAQLDLEEAEAEYLRPFLSNDANALPDATDDDLTRSAQLAVLHLLRLDRARIAKHQELHVCAAKIPIEDRLWATDREKDAVQDRDLAHRGEVALQVHDEAIRTLRWMWKANEVDA